MTLGTKGLHEDREQRQKTPFVPALAKESIDGNRMRTRERDSEIRRKRVYLYRFIASIHFHSEEFYCIIQSAKAILGYCP